MNGSHDDLTQGLAMLLRGVTRQAATDAVTEALARLGITDAADVRPASLPPARHSKDFRSVHWFGTAYSFSPTQAACVRILWEAWGAGVPDVGQHYILETAGSVSERLRSVFAGHDAWGVLIVVGRSKGTYRLAEPDEPDEADDPA